MAWNGLKSVACCLLRKGDMRADNENLSRALRLSEAMLELARRADAERREGRCGQLFGLLRESAYKLRQLAKDEVTRHRGDGRWE